MGWFEDNAPTASGQGIRATAGPYQAPAHPSGGYVPAHQGGSPVPGASDYWGQVGAAMSDPVTGGTTPTGNNAAPPSAPPEMVTGGGKYPLYASGDGGLNAPWTTPFSFDKADLEKDPGYEFTLAEGMKALERGTAANGTLFSPQFRAGAQKYAAGLASQHFNDSYNRARDEYRTAYDIFENNRTGEYNRTSSLAGLGQTAANNLGDRGGVYANSASDLITGAGNAQAAGRVGSANAWNGGLRAAADSALAYEQLRRPNPYILA